MNPPLLSPDVFAPVFEPLQDRRIGYVRSLGNVGDALIEAATFQLFARYDIDYRVVNPRKREVDKNLVAGCDELVWAGGGNMGQFWRDEYEIRNQARQFGLPMTVLPQTFIGEPETGRYKRVWVRECESLQYWPKAVTTHDLSLGYACGETLEVPDRSLGYFMRSGRLQTDDTRGRDPKLICQTPQQYIIFASRYKRIITNRLHFAVAGLIAEREVVLRPCDHFKNRAVWEHSLRDLGCHYEE